MTRRTLRATLLLAQAALVLPSVCFAATSSPSAAAPIYAACFWDAPTHTSLQNTFAGVDKPCPPVRSDALRLGTDYALTPPTIDHSVWQTGSQSQQIQLLAYVRDEYVQAVLISIADSSTSPGSLRALQSSSETYPSLLLSRTDDATRPAWGTVKSTGYVQALWSRLVELDLVDFTRSMLVTDWSGRINSLSFPGLPSSATVRTARLPPTMMLPATTVEVLLLDPSDPQNTIQTTVCQPHLWDGTGCSLPRFGEPSEALRGFLSTEDAATLTQRLVLDVCEHGWDITSISDHTTIQFAPPDPTIYTAALNQPQEYKALIYARDEHASTVLVSLTAPLDGSAIYSQNLYSHSTITSMGALGAYGAVYSNVLWTRLVNASVVVVGRDQSGNIVSAAFRGQPSNTTELETTLPMWIDQQYENSTYPPTRVYVRLLDASFEALKGRVCLSDQWDDVARTCSLAPPTSSTGSGPPGSPDSGLSKGAIIAIAFGAGAAAAVLFVVLFCCIRRRHARRAARERGLDEQMQPRETDYQPLQGGDQRTQGTQARGIVASQQQQQQQGRKPGGGLQGSPPSPLAHSQQQPARVSSSFGAGSPRRFAQPATQQFIL